MFEKVTLRSTKENTPISAGQLAEALLYYQKVHLFIERGSLFNLIHQLGIDGLLRVLERPEIEATYCEELAAISSDSEGKSPYYEIKTTVYAGKQSSGKLRKLPIRLEEELIGKGYSKLESLRFSNLFTARVPVRKLSSEHYAKKGIISAVQVDMLDEGFIRSAIRKILTIQTNGLFRDENFIFQVFNTDNGQLYVDTNINFDSINKHKLSLNPVAEPLNIARLLSFLLSARIDLSLASFYGSDFITSEIISEIIQIRHSEILNRTNLNLEDQQQFTNVVLPDSPSLSEVIDKGERSFDEFLQLLDDAKRYKKWVYGVNPDEGLIISYQRELTKKGWLDKIPTKIARYLITSQIGNFVDPMIDGIVGVVDSLLIDNLKIGWKPNHFIDNQLSKFIQ